MALRHGGYHGTIAYSVMYVSNWIGSAVCSTDLGTRHYQLQTGSFISPDPLLKPYDPQDFNPRQYAEGNPAKAAEHREGTYPGG